MKLMSAVIFMRITVQKCQVMGNMLKLDVYQISVAIYPANYTVSSYT